MTSTPRAIAFDLLRTAEEKERHLDGLLEEAAHHHNLDRRDRAFVSALLYGVTRWRRSLDSLINDCSSTPFAQLHPDVVALLRLALYQILLMDGVPERAAVSETVSLAKEVLQQKNLPGFVNGVLRGFLRKNKNRPFAEAVQRALPKKIDPLVRFSLEHSLPQWLAKRWVGNFGETTATTIAKATNQRAPVFVRRNRLKGSESDFLQEMTKASIDAVPFPFVATGYRLTHGSVTPRHPLFIDGWLQPQDGSSMIAASLLDPKPGDQIIDLCCGKGIKSGAFAEAMNNEGRIVCLDLSGERLRALNENMRRLGVTIHKSAVCDVTGAWPPQGPFAKIYVDAPCSATGVIRRHPESKWNRDQTLVARMALLQTTLLKTALAMLAPGGRLVYSVCSIEPEEGVEQIKRALAADETVRREPLPTPLASFATGAGDLLIAPGQEEMDGFFAALLIRDW